MRWHARLSAEKWAARPLEERIAMVENEISRARHAQETGYRGSVKLALERALELLDLTIETSIRESALRDLLRWRERIARAYLLPEDRIPEDLSQP